jgi:anti-sigma factor RsiW
MKCQKVCDLLKSDYLDGELSEELRRETDRHLEHCSACRQLKQELDSQRIALRGIGQQEVPAQIWQNIQNTILKEQLRQQTNIFSYARDGLRRFFYSPRPALVLAATFAVFIIALFVGRVILSQRSPLNVAIGEDVFRDYRLNGDREIYNFGTDIEEYFL